MLNKVKNSQIKILCLTILIIASNNLLFAKSKESDKKRNSNPSHQNKPQTTKIENAPQKHVDYSKNQYVQKIKLPENVNADFYIVDFYQNMTRNKYININVIKKDPEWQKLKSIFDEHIVNNPKYSETPRIPKIIHQIWLGNNGKLPEKYWHLQKTWLEKHPDWKYMLWTEKEIDDLKLEKRDLYDEADNYGSKADIARYEILYRFGGLYVDTDFECIKQFDILHHICDFYIGIIYDKSAIMANGLIAAYPEHPILKSCIDNLKHKLPGKETPDQIMHRTGPYLISECFFKTVDSCTGPCVAFPVGYFYPWPGYLRFENSPEQIKQWINPETIANHHWFVSWDTTKKK